MRAFLRRMAKKISPKWLLTGWRRLTAWQFARRERRHWDGRIAEVVACKDNSRLPRVPNAGEIQEGFQIMHNGIKVLVDGYYGAGITRMLQKNRGSHEPQEEVVFDAIVRTLPAGSVMIEAGAYWGFYSMWFMKVVEAGRVFLIEPEIQNLKVGKTNFAANNVQGDFTHAYVGAKPGIHPDGTPVVSIGAIFSEKNLGRVSVLHADVQGFEMELLSSAVQQFKMGAVDYVFLSTHRPELHAACLDFLQAHRCRILASVDLKETCCYDGIIVACGPHVSPPVFDPPSKKVTGGT